MKLSTTSIALASAVAASPAHIFTDSTNSELNARGLSNIHEGAGLNVVFLSDSLVPYSYNETANAIYVPGQGVPSDENLMRVFDNTLLVGIAGDTLVRPLNGYLTVNGSADLFYACKPGVPYDPYKYSESSYGIAVFNPGDLIPTTCENIKIHAFV